MGRRIDQSKRIRRFMLERDDRTRCLGCGSVAPRGGFLGTSRWNAKANLCSPCCLLEAFRDDPFGLARLPGGKDHKEATA